jgi:hypothetical protein
MISRYVKDDTKKHIILISQYKKSKNTSKNQGQINIKIINKLINNSRSVLPAGTLQLTKHNRLPGKIIITQTAFYDKKITDYATIFSMLR